MLHPTRLINRVGRNIRVVRIVAGNVLAVGQDSGPGVRKHLIVSGLCAVLRDRKAGQLGSTWSQLCDPADHWNSDQRLSAPAFAGGYEGVSAFARNGAGVADAFKEPVLVLVVCIHLPVVAAR